MGTMPRTPLLPAARANFASVTWPSITFSIRDLALRICNVCVTGAYSTSGSATGRKRDVCQGRLGVHFGGMPRKTSKKDDKKSKAKDNPHWTDHPVYVAVLDISYAHMYAFSRTNTYINAHGAYIFTHTRGAR
eukprot:998258-Amorphochlora_amoeboformis.AAC.1